MVSFDDDFSTLCKEELLVLLKELNGGPQPSLMTLFGLKCGDMLKSGMGGALIMLRRLWHLDFPGLPKLPASLRGLAWFGILYGGWRFGNFKKIALYLWNNFPLVREAIAYWRGPTIKPAKPDHTAGAALRGGRVMEAARSGSSEVPLTTSKAQVLIGQYKNGHLESHGCAVRMNDYLVLPDHVFSYHRRAGETARVYAFVNRNKDSVKPVEITSKEVCELDTDLVYIKLTHAEWSTMGVGTMTIMHDIPSNGVYAQVVGHAGLGTTGTLRHDPTCFGRVVYDASTFPGYSGAIYVVSNRIAGIHQSGSEHVNGGYSASYVWATLSHLEKMAKEESTEDWLKEQYFDHDNWLEIDPTWYDIDTARVKVGGHYHIVEKETLDNAFGSEWKGKTRFGKKSRRQYADFESEEQEPLNGKGQLNSGDSTNQKAVCPVSEGNQVLQLTAGFSQLSDEQQRQVLKTFGDIRQRSNIQKGILSKKK